MSYNTGFYKGRLGIGLTSSMGMGDGNPRYPLDINGDIRLTGSILNANGQVLSLVPVEQGNWSIGNNNLSYTGGNVGIGTTSPDAKLDVNGAVRGAYNTDTYCYFGRAFIGASGHADYAGFGHLDMASSVNYGFMQGHTGWTYVNGGAGNGICFRANNVDKMRMDGAGNFGIGTTSPSKKLSVDGVINIVCDDGDKLHWTHLDHGSKVGHSTGWSVDYYAGSTNDTNNRGSHKFFTSSSNAWVERMRVNENGNVGIGTTSPDRGLCILDNQNTGADMGLYPLGYNSNYQEPASLKIFQHLPLPSTSRISDGGGNLNPAINIVANYVNSSANSTSHLGGSIQFTTQSRLGAGAGAGHGQAYAAIYGGRHSGYTNYEGEMIFYTSDTSNRDSGVNLNPRMTIKGGNVGIGTNTTIQNVCALTVKGQTASPTTATMSLTSSQAIARFSGGQGQILEIGAESGSGWDMWMQTHNGGTGSSNSRNLCLQPIEGNVVIGTMGKYQDAELSINVPDEGTMLCSPDISQFLWRINNAYASAWGIYWSTNGSGNNHYFHSDSNPNQIIFVGNGTGRACIDLDNGAIRTKDWFYMDGSDDGIYWQQHGGGWNMTDSTWMRLYGSKSIYMNTGGLRIDDCSDQSESSGIHLRGNYPTMWFRDYDNASFMIHINSGYFYVLSGGTDTVTWSTVNSCWPLMIRRSDHGVKIGYCIGAGDSWPTYRIQAFGGHLESEHGYEVLARNNSSKNGDWLYLDSYSNAPSGYHAQSCDGSNMYFYVHGYYAAYVRYNGGGSMNFTGQHKAIPKDAKLLKCVRNYVGLIAVSTGSINSMIENEDTGVYEMKRKMNGIDINEAIPEVILSTSYKQKTVYGVISDGEDDEYYNSHKRSTGKNCPDGQRPFQKKFPSQSSSDRTIKEFSWGAWGTVIQCEEDDNRLFINSVGEGGIWVCDEMGLIENGDYITSSNIPGYGCFQDDDVLHNYTVAKATMDCDFTLSWAGQKEKKEYRKGTWCIDKRRRHEDSDSESDCECDDIDEDHHYGEHYEPDCSNVSHKKDKHGMVYYPDAICHDPSGCCEMETCCDCSGNPIIEDYYFEDADYKCKEITHNGKTYRVAFIACTYHCG